MTIPFAPAATTVALSASNASSNAAFSGVGSSVEFQNAGNVTVFIATGGSSVTATTAGYPILAGQSKVIGRDPSNETYFAAITASGTATVYATCGEGA